MTDTSDLQRQIDALQRQLDEARRTISAHALRQQELADSLSRVVATLASTAEVMAADRMAAVGCLAAGVAHEINNPLAYVIANLGLLHEELPKLVLEPKDSRLGEINEILHDCRDGAERVGRIVRDLKFFSRQDEVEASAVDLTPVIEFSIKMAESEIRHRARVVKELGDAPLVRGDHGRLGQVLLNLIVNAAQSIREGNVEANVIRIVTRSTDGGGAMVEVHDTGAGIAPEALARIFLPFFSTKPVGAGMGLGLSVCHALVASLGGDITVTSELGKGSVFRVTLPAARVERPCVAHFIPSEVERSG